MDDTQKTRAELLCEIAALRRQVAQLETTDTAQLQQMLAECITQLSRETVEHQQAKDRFRAAQDISLEGFTILRSLRDDLGTIVDFEWIYANRAAGKILKQPPEQLAGQRLLEVLPGNRENRALFERYVRIVETGQGDEVELRYQSEGIDGWFRNMAVKLNDGVAVSFSDITARKRAEAILRRDNAALERVVAERAADLAAANAHLRRALAERQYAETALRENERILHQLKKAIETTGIGITITDTTGKIIYTNPADAQMHGYTASELIGQPAHIFTTPEQRQPARPLRDDEPVFRDWRRERQNMRRDGSIFPAKLTSNPIYDTHKFRIGTVTVCEDISEHKRMEEALRASEERLRNIVQNMPILCDAFDEHGVALFWNKECERVTGYAADEIVNNPHSLELLTPDPAYRAKVIEQLSALGHQYRDWELEIRRKDGEKRVISWSNISRRCPLPGWWSWGVGVDVTERKRAEEELQRTKQALEITNAQLQELNASKDRFFSIIAHDLKNPLHSFLSFAQILEMFETYSPEERQTFIHRFSEAAEHLLALLENLLTWARSQQGQIPYAPHELPLAALAAHAFELVRPHADGKQIRLINAIPRTLLAFADFDMLETIFRNLLTNAIKFTPTGGSVTIAARATESAVEISVSDTGVGMPPDKAAMLFQLGQKTRQLGTAGEKGTGVGLLLCKEFIKTHGGTIWCESVVGQGTIFHFTLPKP